MSPASPTCPSGVPFRSNHVGIVRGRLPRALVARTPFSDADAAVAPAISVMLAPVTLRVFRSNGCATRPVASIPSRYEPRPPAAGGRCVATHRRSASAQRHRACRHRSPLPTGVERVKRNRRPSGRNIGHVSLLAPRRVDLSSRRPVCDRPRIGVRFPGQFSGQWSPRRSGSLHHDSSFRRR
jgi:hypothetical protein